MKNPSRLPLGDPPVGTQRIVKYTTIVRPQRRYRVWQRVAGGLTLLLTLSLLSVYFFYQQAQPLARQPGVVMVVAATVNNSNRLPTGTLRQGPTPTPNQPATIDLFAAPARTPTGLGDNGTDPASIFSLPTDDAADHQLPTSPAITDTVTTLADPLVIAAKTQPQLYSTFLRAQDALEQADPEQAVATLLTLAQNHPTYLAEQVKALLYRAYLAGGDQRMRDGDRSGATEYYALAQQLAVADQSALTRRLESMAKFQQVITVAAVATTTVVPPDLAVPTAERAVATPPATPTSEPTPIAASVVAENSARCPNAQVTISAPAAGTLLTGAVGFTGSAVQDNFWFYKLEWAPAGSETFAYFAGSRLAVTSGWLGTLDTTTLLNGDYVIRLTVVDLTGNYPPPCDVGVRVEN